MDFLSGPTRTSARVEAGTGVLAVATPTWKLASSSVRSLLRCCGGGGATCSGSAYSSEHLKKLFLERCSAILTGPPPADGWLSFWRNRGVVRAGGSAHAAARRRSLTIFLLRRPRMSRASVRKACGGARRYCLCQRRTVDKVRAAHLLHADAGLGAGFQELDGVVDGELRDRGRSAGGGASVENVCAHLLSSLLGNLSPVVHVTLVPQDHPLHVWRGVLQTATPITGGQLTREPPRGGVPLRCCGSSS